MPFSFNSLPTTDAGATIASVAGQSPASPGQPATSAAAPSDASFDTCLTQAKQTPGITIPGKKPATSKAAADTGETVTKSDTEGATEGADDDASQSTEPGTKASTSPVDPLAQLNSLLGLMAPPAPPAADAPTDSAASNDVPYQAGTPAADSTGVQTGTPDANAFSKAVRFARARGTSKGDTSDQSSTALPAARIPKGIDAEAAAAAPTPVTSELQASPASDQTVATAVSADPATRATSARGLKGPTSKSLGRKVTADTNANLASTLSVSALGTAPSPETTEAAPVSNSVRSLRAMKFSTPPALSADLLAPGTPVNPAAMAGAQAMVAAVVAGTPTAPVAANDSASAASPTARDLLAAGAPVLDYTVSPDQTLALRAPKGAKNQRNEFSLTDIAFPVGPASVTDLAAYTSVSSDPALSTNASPVLPAGSQVDALPMPAQKDLQATLTAVQGPDLIPTADLAVVASSVAPSTTSSRFDVVNTSAVTPQAKIAATGDGRVSSPVSGEKSSTRARKNNSLVAGDKGVVPGTSGVGTDTAKRVPVMSNNSSDHAETARPSDPFLSLAGVSSSSAKTSGSSPTESAAANPTLTSHAAQAVREIRDISDGLWAIDRNSVEVRFTFTETEKLSVRVELKDGAVHTTFRTDSPELRDTLAREWQTQAQGSSSDVRPYLVADPVFGSAASNSDQRGSFAGGDASRQQQQQRSFEQSTGNGALSFPGSRTSSSSAVSAPNPAQRILKTDTSIHLNAFA